MVGPNSSPFTSLLISMTIRGSQEGNWSSPKPQFSTPYLVQTPPLVELHTIHKGLHKPLSLNALLLKVEDPKQETVTYQAFDIPQLGQYRKFSNQHALKAREELTSSQVSLGARTLKIFKQTYLSPLVSH